MATNNPARRRKVSREPLSLFPDTPRWCHGCQRHLPPGAFSRDKKQRDGLHVSCRECRSASRKAAYTPAVALRLQQRHIVRTYSIAPEEFARMVAQQDNQCAICRWDMGTSKDRHVDHCHRTGRVRALLCSRCNTTIGQTEDDPALLRAMADYLERHAVVEVS